MSDELNTSPTLIRLVQDKQHGAWERFYEVYHAYVYCIARGMKMSHEDATDVAQDVMLNVWKGIENYEYRPGTAKFRTWLHKVTRNAVFALIRKRKLKLASFDEGPEQKTQYLDDIAVNELETIAENEWRIFLTNQALERLKLQFRGQAMTIFLAAMNGESTAAIAERLGLNRPTVTRLKNRVRHRLTQEIRNLRQELE